MRASTDGARRRSGSGATQAPAGGFATSPALASSTVATAPDATLRRLVATAYGHGRGARRNDVRKHAAPPLSAELRILAGCAWHTLRRRCANGS